MLRRSILCIPTGLGDMIMARITLALALVLSTLTGVAGSAYARPYYVTANHAIKDGLTTQRMGGGS